MKKVHKISPTHNLTRELDGVPSPSPPTETKGESSHLKHEKEMETHKKLILVREQRAFAAALGHVASNSLSEQDIWCL